MTEISLDFETKSEVDLKTRGLDNYSADPSTEVLLCAYRFDRTSEPKLWDIEDGVPFPREVKEALLDPHVKKRAFNAQFERVITKRVLKIDTPVEGWRCTMVGSYMRSFTGNLANVGAQVGLPIEKQKLSEGTRLIRVFCSPQKTTTKNPLRWRNAWTDPEDWELFRQYCPQDVVAEGAILDFLDKQPIPESEWELYEIDQIINERGIPIDPLFVKNAIGMAARRKAELTQELIHITGLRNPNSPDQLKGWLKERGYPFDDLRADTVKKVILDNAEAAKVAVTMRDEEAYETVAAKGTLSEEVIQTLLLRQQAARTSVTKYNAMQRLMGENNRLRFCFQFHGASRTGRDSGRGFNAQNLTRTPRELEMSKAAIAAGVPYDFSLAMVTDLIRADDYDGLVMSISEPMNALAGTVRSAVRAEDGEEQVSADLASIETVTIAGITGCERLLNVFRNGKDAYIDFASSWLKKHYDEVTKKERGDAKPAVLGSGFGLGGGDIKDGKRTGLWGYAENMGVNLTKEEAHSATKLFRATYPEIPMAWKALENTVFAAIRNPGKRFRPVLRRGDFKFTMPVEIIMEGEFLKIYLPSGRPLHYHKPRIEKRIRKGRPTEAHPEGEPWETENFTYMGKGDTGAAWIRIWSHGGKIIENIVQAVARDILMAGMKRAHEEGFRLFLRVHDELVALVRKGENRLTKEYLCQLMSERLDWFPNLPLKAAGWQAVFYRKD